MAETKSGTWMGSPVAEVLAVVALDELLAGARRAVRHAGSGQVLPRHVEALEDLARETRARLGGGSED